MKNFTLPSELKGVHIHFVGIKGTGMAALTEILHARGAFITGSDVEDVFYTDQVLAAIGIKALPFSAENITGDICCVIYSSAYNFETNCELQIAREKHIPCLLYSQALGQISAHAYSCGIAGVHGKTTTTGLTGSILQQFSLPVQVLAGSMISSFSTHGSCTLNRGHKYFVAETCEYQRHFMDFHPQKIILTSVESDHQDYYPTYNDILNAFVDYICLLPAGGQLIYCCDDKGACEAVSLAEKKRSDIVFTPYGEGADSEFKITFGKVETGRQYFSLKAFGDYQFYLRIPGKHLVLNAAAAIALVVGLLQADSSAECKPGTEPLQGTAQGSDTGHVFSTDTADKIAAGLASFTGGKRRSEILGEWKNVLFIDDYGHHPTAVEKTLEGYKKFYPDRLLIVDFMAHTYSRTAALLEEFARCFSAADQVILHKIYGSAREKAEDASVTGKTLWEKVSEHHPYVRYYEEIMDALPDMKRELESSQNKGAKNGTDAEKILFITMGAGDNWKLGRKLLEDLQGEQL